MDTTQKRKLTKTMLRQRLPIETYAVLTESAPETGAMLDNWYDYYQPSTPGECALLDLAVMASVTLRRTLGCLTEIVNEQVRTAIFRYDCGHEDDVQRYRDLLPTQPGVALVGLKRSALGVRFLIGRWERLLRLLHEEGTLYGNDRDEAIHYQGARATNKENLFQSEGAYLTHLYCLMCQPEPKDEHLVEIGNERFMPTALMDRDIAHWSGPIEVSRKLLIELAERELAHLRPREELLRATFEIPGRDGAEAREQVIAGPLGAQLVRQAELHERQLLRSYNAFVKGRNQSAKSNRLPGEPDPDMHGEGEPEATAAAAAEPEARRTAVSAEEAREQRKQAAAVLAPGGANSIAAPMARADDWRTKVVEVDRYLREAGLIGDRPAGAENPPS
jgi:hypothetical protein